MPCALLNVPLNHSGNYASYQLMCTRHHNVEPQYNMFQLIFRMCSVPISAGTPDILAGFSWFSSVPPVNCRVSQKAYFKPLFNPSLLNLRTTGWYIVQIRGEHNMDPNWFLSGPRKCYWIIKHFLKLKLRKRLPSAASSAICRFNAENVYYSFIKTEFRTIGSTCLWPCKTLVTPNLSLRLQIVSFPGLDT
jgi:hypothetical protein